MKWNFLFAVVIATLSACGGGGGAAPDINTGTSHAVALSTDFEVPAVTGNASGQGTVTVDVSSGDIDGSVTLSGLSSMVTSAHIHRGVAGRNGSPVITLVAGNDNNTWVIPAGSELTTTLVEDFEAGLLYLNVHTTNQPTGEVRGQILPTGIVVIRSELTGLQQVPAVTSSASGIGYATLNESSGEIHANIRTAGLATTETMAHIHEGDSGTNGGIVVTLQQADPQDSSFWVTGDGASLDASALASYSSGDLYFNLHTSTHTSGELRGQLSSTGGTGGGDTPGNQAPVARMIISPNVGTAGEALIFDASPSSDPDQGDSIVSYRWEFNNDIQGVDQTITQYFDQPGSYEVTLTITDSEGLQDSLTKSFTVLRSDYSPDAGFSLSSQQSLNVGVVASAPLKDPYNFDHTFTWDFGDGTSANGKNASHQYMQAGTYTIKLTVTDYYDATSSSQQTISVSTTGAGNQPPVASFTATPVTGEAALTVQLDASASSDPNGDTLTYSWNFDDGQSFSGSNANTSHTFNQAGTYDITLTVTDTSGASTPTTRIITVTEPQPDNQPPVADFTSQIANLSINVDGSSSSDPDVNDAITTYAWNFDDGTTLSGVTAFHSYAIAGTYTITLTVTDSQGASHTTQQQVTVEDATNQPPIAVITIDRVTGTAPLEIIINANGSSDPDGSIASYRWSFGEGEDASGSSATHTYETVGQFTLTLTVTDNQGLAGSATQQISVNNNPASFTLLSLGDSITQSDSGHLSYRYPLWKLLLDGGYDADFIGGEDSNNSGNPVWPDHSGQSFDQDHEGHWGKRADEVYSILQAQTYVPDIVLMHLGTNDFLQDQGDASTEQDLRNIIANLRSKNSGVIILFAQLIPTNGTTPSTNAVIANLGAELSTATSPIVVVDQNSGFISSTDTFDGIHPNASGENKMAQRWYDAIVANLP